MARVNKAHGVRKAELLDAAWALFDEQGYNLTTVNAIIERIGVSKGTFYHYFASKQEVLEAVVEREVAQTRQSLEDAVSDENLDAKQKLNRFFNASWRIKLAYIDTIRWMVPVVLEEGDILLRHKFDEKIAQVSSNILISIIEQGVLEQVFDTPSAEGTATLIVRSWDYLKSAGVRSLAALPDRQHIRSQLEFAHEFYLDTVERLLGMTSGSLARPSLDYYSAFTDIYANLASSVQNSRTRTS
jgi:AcrR family transcriptional regulator